MLFFQIVAIAMVFSCVLRKLDEDDDKEEVAAANAHPQKDEEAIAKEEDPVHMLGEEAKGLGGIHAQAENIRW